MKRLALLGGTSYPSTIIYYQMLNRLYHARLGGHHSCPLVLFNIDYHDIKCRYNGKWEEIPELLRQQIRTLISYNPTAIVLCNNTLHKALDVIKDEIPFGTQVFHAVDLTREYLKEKRIRTALLLGTKFTMEDSFFKDPLSKEGISVTIPEEYEREEIQRIQNELAAGRLNEHHSQYFDRLADKYEYCDAIILACTELPLAFGNTQGKAEIVNPIELQCIRAVDYLTQNDTTS